MAGAGGKITMKLITIAIGIPVTIAARKLTNAVFEAVRPEAELRDVDDSGVDWTDALVWSAISGIGLALGQLATRKGAEEAWRVVLGTEPPPQPLSKTQKKALKQQEKAEAKAEKAVQKA